MKDSIKMELSRRMPQHAEGWVRIDLTDPITGKVKERIEGKNHVFPDSLFSNGGWYNSSMYWNWQAVISGSLLVLNDSTVAVDTTFPYILGQTVGYGKPNNAGSGLYRGAYNVANQALAVMDLTKVHWKFQYDFTTAQANGVAISTVGLTSQYQQGVLKRNAPTMFKIPHNTAQASLTNDGRYAYSCSTAGIITKYDLWLNTNSTIDVSATTGTTGADTKTVGYDPATGKYFIYVYSATAGNRKVYKFSGATFVTLETTYSVSNIAYSTSSPMYVGGNYIYSFTTSSNTIYKADFVNNIAYTTWTLSTVNNAVITEYATTNNCRPQWGLTCINGLVFCGLCAYATGDGGRGYIFDLTAGTIVGYVSPITIDNAQYTCCRYPIGTTKFYCHTKVTNPTYDYWEGSFHNAALTQYVLASPVTKTSANGMTATYELDVNW